MDDGEGAYSRRSMPLPASEVLNSWVLDLYTSNDYRIPLHRVMALYLS